MKMVKCLREFEYFSVFLKIETFFSKIRRSKVTDYAALKKILFYVSSIYKSMQVNDPI